MLMTKSKVSASTFHKLLSVFLAILMVFSTLLSTGMNVFATDSASASGDDVGYTVTLSDTKHGTVSFTDTKKTSKDFDVSEVVRVLVEPDDGYIIDTVIASYEDSGVDYALTAENNVVAFEMPEENVNIKATFAVDTIAKASFALFATPRAGYTVDLINIPTCDQPRIEINGVDGFCIDHNGGYPNVKSFTKSSSSPLSSSEESNLEKLFNKAESLGYMNGSIAQYSALQFYSWKIADNYTSGLYAFNEACSSQKSALSSYSSYDVLKTKPKISKITLTYNSSTNTWVGSGTDSNKVLSNYTVSNAGGLTAKISGNTLTITATTTEAMNAYNKGGTTIKLKSKNEIYNSDDFIYGTIPTTNGAQKVVYPVKSSLTSNVSVDVEALGNFSLTKTSADAGYTNGNSSGYGNLTDAVFTLTGPTGSSSKSHVLTYDSSTRSWHCDDLMPGNYLLKETGVPRGFSTFNSNGMSVTITAGKTTTKTVSDPARKVNFNLQKRTATSGQCVVNGNSNYSLAGAEFTLTQTGATTNHSYSLTTDVNGNASVTNIPRGTYILKETKAPIGYDLNRTLAAGVTLVLDESSTASNLTYNSSNRTYTYTAYDDPITDPIGVFLQKNDPVYRDQARGDGSLAGGKFEVKIFSQANLKDNQMASVKNQEIIRFTVVTDSVGVASADRQHITDFWAKNGSSLDSWFDSNGDFKFPFGTYNITETDPPEGYLNDDVPIDLEDIEVKNPDYVKDCLSWSNNSFTINFSAESYEKYGYPGNYLTVDNAPKAVENHILYGGVSIRKADNQSHESWGQGDAELAATFAIYNASAGPVICKGTEYKPGDFVTTITADESNGYVASTGNKDLSYGTYLIVESGTSDDYNSSHYTYTLEVHPSKEEDGKMYNLITADFQAENPVKRGGVSVVKFTEDFFAASPEGDASLAGAEYTVYNDSERAVYDIEGNRYDVGDAVVTIKTNNDGFATTGANYLPIGSYIIKETKASQGYKLNTVWQKQFKITAEGMVADYTVIPSSSSNIDFTTNDVSDHNAANEAVIRGGIKIYKSDKDRIDANPVGDESEPQGDATLENAHFIVINRSTNKVIVNGQIFQPGQICMTLHTNAQGIAQTAADALPYGTYEVKEAGKETAASTPFGYFVDAGWSATVYIREDGKIVNANTYESNPVKEQVYRGGFKFLKIDAERNEAIPQGDATLENALFYVTNMSASDVYVNNQWYAPGEVCYTFKTDVNGGFESAKNALPYGSYRITEAAPSTGYLLNTDYYLDFQIRENNKVYDLTGTPCGEYVIRGDVQIVKYDIELNKSEAIGGKDHGNNQYGTDLNGIELAIVNRSKELVIVDGVRYQPGDVCKTITTHWNDELEAYTAETTGRTLPYGTYDIYEVSSDLSTDNDDLANEYYLRSDAILTFQIREDSKTVTMDTDGNALIFKDQVVRGDIEFRKIADSTSARMNTAWVVTNNTTGERHVIVADKNGEFYSASSRVKHTTNTNCNDVFLDRIDAGERINMSEFTQRNRQGVWFGLGEDGTMAEPDNSVCALPYGQYTISEIPTDTNEGYGLQEFVFYIYENNQVVDLGTITNDPIEISTELIDDETDGHVALAQKETLLVDTVEYEGLTNSREYTMSGRLVDIETGAVVVTATTDFTSKSHGKVEVTFDFDATDLAGHNIVAYESIIDKNTGYKVAEHADATDKDQIVSFPAIGTEAFSDVTSDHDAPSLNKIVITDTVDYSNLVVNKKYTVTGVLMNKTTGDEVFGSDGREITATTTFTARDASGSVTLDFEFDASALAGQTVVVFEELEYKDNIVAVHQDINDDDQTIYIPQISTNAVFEATGTDEGAAIADAVIEDTVTYKNLLAGKQYKLSGKLMDKDTGEIIKDADGNDVVAEKTFVPSTADGSVTVDFNFNATNMAGKTVVVFETLTRNDIEMAIHQDINDDSQTVRFPWIGTTANYMDTDIHEALADDKAVVTDHVEYKALKAGSEYTMNGVLVDKATGVAIADNDGNAITASTKFTPDKSEGTVDVVFEFDASALAGHTVVAYESLNHNGVDVAVHQDIDDTEQTIYFPSIRTVMAEKETGLDEVKADGQYTFVDKIFYDNLIAGHEYVIKSQLVDKDTGKVIVDNVETKFTPDESNGITSVEIPFDATDMANKSIVAYEIISYNGVVIAIDNDINNADETITVPEISTVATSALTGDDEGITANDYELTDTVEYKNLVPGRSYTVTGIVMDKGTGEPLKDVQGNEITATKGFVPKEKDGKVDVDFIFDTMQLGGKDIVVFETLSRDGVALAEHRDINDEAQTVHFPKISTSAVYGDTTINEGMPTDKVIIKDTVSYENLREGEEYTLIGTLIDKETGLVVDETTVTGGADLNEDGSVSSSVEAESKPVTSEAKFKADKSSGTTDVVFEFDASSLAGKTVVVYESLVRNDVERTAHNDINDEAQTVHFPEISTAFADKTTGLHESLASSETVLADTVAYKNLTAGNTYVATGMLMDKETGESVKDADGKDITASVEFVPEASDGSVALEFVFDASNFAGKTVVAFETITRDGFVVAEHKDIADENQTVYFPSIGTTATDKSTGTHMLADAENITIVDTVEYTNLKVGSEYTLTGTLMDKETGKPVEFEEGSPVTAVTVMTPEETNGTATVEFVIPNQDITGKTFVVFESLTVGGAVVAEHNDIEDEAQSVHMMTVSTVATGADGRSKTIDIGDKVTVLDTVEYKNLIPGVEYTVVGQLVYKDTEEFVKTSDGSDAVVTAKFTPEKSEGSVNVEFTVDTSKDNGKVLVAYETIYDGDVQIGSHKDIDDKDQSVTVKTVTKLKTGITNIAGVVAVIAVIALFAAVLLIIYRKHKANQRLINGQ